MMISQASRATGLSPDTLRYYDRLGLLPDLARGPGGQRRFSGKDIERLRFIRRARNMDFSLAEIATLARLRDRAGDDRESVRVMAREKLAQISNRLEELRLLKNELELLIHLCEGSDGDACPIVDGIEQRA